ncbi:MAG: O-antigen translocase [Pseudomonadota bacterium]
MSLKRAASLSMLQSLVSVGTSFLSVKITSVYLGPAGMGLLGQLQQFIAMVQGVVASGLNTGIVRRTAQLGEQPQARAQVVSTVMRLVLLGGLPVALVIAFGSGWLARELLHDAALRMPVLLFSGVYVAGLLGTLVLATANGARDYRTVTLIQIGTALGSLALFALLCPTLGVPGGLYAAALIPSATALAGWLVARRQPWWPARPLSHGFSRPEARAALAFVPMAATSAIAAPLVQILVRDTLARHSGMASVGLLNGVMRLSDLYVNIATSVLGMYFLPRFAELRESAPLKREIRKGLATLIPAVAAASLALYLLRDWVVRLVFTAEFHAMRDLFAWQMTGNVLKVAGWFFGHLMIAKGNPLAMAGFELLMGLFWWAAGVVLVERNGAVGATQAYALHNAVYLAVGVVAITVILRRIAAREAKGAAA